MKKQVKIALVILVAGFVGFVIVGYKWLNERKLYASTDAFFVKSNRISNVSFKRVSGKIIKMNFKEGDVINREDIIAEIDDADYILKIEKIEHNIKALEAEKQSLGENRVKTLKSLNIEKNIKKDTFSSVEKKMESLLQNIKGIDAQISLLERDYARYNRLIDEKAVPLRNFEDIQTNLETLKFKRGALSAELESLKYTKRIAQKDIKLVDVKKRTVSEIDSKLDALQENIEVLHKERQDLTGMINDCKLKSPFSGIAGKKYAEIGSVVKAGSFIYSIVDVEDLYGYVLMEEEKIKGVNSGDHAEIKIDAYPDEKFEGEVVEVYPASAATYALIPRDISAGEFTKVSQRIPIRVKFISGNLGLLKVGLGGEIKIKR